MFAGIIITLAVICLLIGLLTGFLALFANGMSDAPPGMNISYRIPTIFLALGAFLLSWWLSFR